VAKINFALGIHNHQPVGNFDSVFETAFTQSYQPFLETVLDHPHIKFSLHTSGCMLEWFEKHNRDYFNLVAKLLERGQVELLGGGFYEPILSVLPHDDALEQVVRMRTYLKKRFGVTVRGAWLPERVWEPSLAALLAEAEVEYLPLDDDQFLAAGHFPEELSGYFLTEAGRGPLALFPIQKALRYTIPFQEPQASLDFMRSMSEGKEQPLFVMADDGEKFGLWPKTYDWVYTQRWLHRFFEMLEQHADEIELVKFGEARDRIAPAGRTYLPTGSYFEMSEWALPPKAQHIFEGLIKESEKRPDWPEIRPFLKGGFWRSFLARYDEINALHKKMVRVSRKYHDLSPRKRRNDLYTPLLRGQCNCPYWHGVFGGLYLPHLRHAVWKELLLSEYATDNAGHRGRKWVDIERVDFDADGFPELLVENAYLNAYISPRKGGMIFEWDYRPAGYNLLNTLTRHEEAYHAKLSQAVYEGDKAQEPAPEQAEAKEETASIHDLVLTKEPHLEKVLTYDRWPRRALLDHFPGWNSTIQEFRDGVMADYGDFLQGSYELGELFTDAAALTRRGTLGNGPVEITKTIRVVPGHPVLKIHYRIRNLATFELHSPFGIEWNLALQAPHSHLHYISLPDHQLLRKPLAVTEEQIGVSTIVLADEHEGVSAQFQFENPVKLWRAPVESISLSEGGFERIFQSIALLFQWELHLPAGAAWETSFTATLDDA
jgi:alpha-amylase